MRRLNICTQMLADVWHEAKSGTSEPEHRLPAFLNIVADAHDDHFLGVFRCWLLCDTRQWVSRMSLSKKLPKKFWTCAIVMQVYSDAGCPMSCAREREEELSVFPKPLAHTTAVMQVYTDVG